MKLVFIIVFLCFFYPLFCVTFKSSQYGLKQGIHSTFHLSERRCYGTIHRTGHMSRRGSQRMPMRWFQSERHYLKAFPLASISTGDHQWGDYLGDGAKQQQSSKIQRSDLKSPSTRSRCFIRSEIARSLYFGYRYRRNLRRQLLFTFHSSHCDFG